METVQTSIYPKKHIHEMLTNIANKQKRSLNNLICIVLEDFIESELDKSLNKEENERDTKKKI